MYAAYEAQRPRPPEPLASLTSLSQVSLYMSLKDSLTKETKCQFQILKYNPDLVQKITRWSKSSFRREHREAGLYYLAKTVECGPGWKGENQNSLKQDSKDLSSMPKLAELLGLFIIYTLPTSKKTETAYHKNIKVRG